jgi:hypothetical protein
LYINSNLSKLDPHHTPSRLKTCENLLTQKSHIDIRCCLESDAASNSNRWSAFNGFFFQTINSSFSNPKIILKSGNKLTAGLRHPMAALRSERQGHGQNHERKRISRMQLWLTVSIAVLALSSYITPADARDIVYCSTLNTGDGTDYSTLMPSET